MSRYAPAPLWYKDAIIYELRVGSFADSNDDGIGDFVGLTSRLPYLQDLGVTAIWLLPFYPSPGKDDGYDIADYFDVDPATGSLDDFRNFLNEAHRRGLNVITEVVINHTSDQHPWFQRARHAPPGSVERDFYVWSDTPDKYQEARIIFPDFEHSNWQWDNVAKAYYWHRFYSHQPDLNFDNPAVHEAVFRVVDFWLEMGVDGLRLDAIPYLYEREGTNCENLPETHEFLRRLRRHVDEKFENRMLLAEANQWPEDAAAYFGDGDECHMNFHFPIMPRLYMAIHQEDRFPLIDILEQTPDIPETAQWALFLRNHDELTLEMVTDEERDYMYDAYANDPVARINLGIRRRLAPLVKNNRRVIELMNGLLFSLPGTPVLYYGDEIGMGDNIYLGDRDGVRTPMQWSADRNGGFSRCNPQRLLLPLIIDPEYHYQSLNVEAQQSSSSSLLWWMKRIISLRKRFLAFGRGDIEFLSPDNPRVLAFIRKFENETILVVANLSRFVQYVELDLSSYEGLLPVELFGRTEFPRIGELPYLLTLGGHAFYWFQLKKARSAALDAKAEAYEPPMIHVTEDWGEILRPGEPRENFERTVQQWLEGRRWYNGAGLLQRSLEIEEAFLLPTGGAALTLVHASYHEGQSERYVLPLGFVPESFSGEIQARAHQAIIAHLRTEKGFFGTVFDLLSDAPSTRQLLELVLAQASIAGSQSTLHGVSLENVPNWPEDGRFLAPENGNATISFDDRLFLKIYRKLQDGVNPELEVSRHLSNIQPPPPVPRLLGYLEQTFRVGEPRTLATLFPYVVNERTAALHTREELGRFLERILIESRSGLPEPTPNVPLLELSLREPPESIAEPIGGFRANVRLVGARVAELHRALSTAAGNPAFEMQTYGTMDQRSLYQSMRNVTGTTLRELRLSRAALTSFGASLAKEVLDFGPTIYDLFAPLLTSRITAKRARIHGTLDLRNMLWLGKDYTIVDFEGDRQRSVADRKRKRSPLRDVASMIRSYQRLATTVCFDPALVREDDLELALPWTDAWADWISAAFLGGYLEEGADLPFLPPDPDELAMLSDLFLLEATLIDLRRTLFENPRRADVALHGLHRLLRRITSMG